jgi:hypothetical protein
VPIVTKAEYARHRGVSKAMITRYVKHSRIAIIDGKVDVAASDAMLAKSISPALGGRGGKRGRTDVPGLSESAGSVPGRADSYNAIRTQRESFVAKTAEVEYRKMVGELVERDRYTAALIENLGPALRRLDTLSARIAFRVAAEQDVRACGIIIDNEIAALRQEISESVLSLASAGGRTKQ